MYSVIVTSLDGQHDWDIVEKELPTIAIAKHSACARAKQTPGVVYRVVDNNGVNMYLYVYGMDEDMDKCLSFYDYSK